MTSNQRFSFVGSLRYAFISILFASASGLTAAPSQLMTLKGISFARDTTAVKKEKVSLAFKAAPPGFPIYAMTNPQRIVIDLPDTRAAKACSSFVPESWFVKKISVTSLESEGSSDVRMEIYLKKNAGYTAYISGSEINLELKEMDKVKHTVPVFTASATQASISSISGIEMRSLEKSFEIEVSFTNIPQAASIYMLIDPARIIMDFNNVFIDTGFNREVNVAPVKSISVIRRGGEIPYAGIVVNLKKEVNFHYEQDGSRLLVRIPWENMLTSRKGKFFLLGTGVILAGGFVTGAILGTDQENGGDNKPEAEDLGPSPEFPAGY